MSTIYFKERLYFNVTPASFGRADHWNTESEAEHNEAYDAYVEHIMSFPSHPFPYKGYVDGQEMHIGKDYIMKQRSKFYKGVYDNKCSFCGEIFHMTDKLWFVCEKCCDELVATPVNSTPSPEAKHRSSFEEMDENTRQTQPPSSEGKDTAMQMLIKWIQEEEAYDSELTPFEIIKKATELLEVEKRNIIDARLSVTGLNHASPTDDKNLEEAELYYKTKYNQS